MILYNLYLTQGEAWIITLGISLGVILILALILFLTCGFRFKRKNFGNKVVIDESYINMLIEALGGFDNINGVSLDNGRVKFIINDLDKIVDDKLKELSSSGVFVSGNNLKMLFRYESVNVVNSLKAKGIKEC